MKLRTSLLFAVLVLEAGCSPDPYQAVADKQVAHWNEMADILGRVQDARSMGEAETQLAAKMREFQEVATEGKFLPPPDQQGLARLEQQRARMQQAANRLKQEMDRVKRLPDGEDFFVRINKIVAPSQRGGR